MPHRQSWPPALLSLLLMLLVFGCAPQPAVRTEPRQAFSGVPHGVDVGSTLAVYPGSLDLKNRYLSNVLILADLEHGGCGGVLIAPDKVLTAAHCVCARREATTADRKKMETRLDQAFPSNGRDDNSKKRIVAWKSNILNNAHAIADSSNCLSQVEVFVINYLAPPSHFSPSAFQGIAVRPHPRFLSLDDNRRHGLFREADLAVIQLNKPVPGSFRAIKLPTADVYKDQRIVMVGYGLGETQYPLTTFGLRHFGESRVMMIDRFASGSTRFSTMEQERDGRELSRNYEGDSGGGGFSLEDDTMLVGIISARSDGRGAVFESVFPHVKWLKAEGT